jgi:hypothetical protein
MEYYSAIKKSEILSFSGKWMELEFIILSEISQAQKSKYCIFSLICGIYTQDDDDDDGGDDDGDDNET